MPTSRPVTVARRCCLIAIVVVDSVAISCLTIGVCALLASSGLSGQVGLEASVGSAGMAGGGVVLLRINGILRRFGHSLVTAGAPCAPGIGDRISERVIARAGGLLPAWARDRYVEEWSDILHGAAAERGRMRWPTRGAELLQCLRAVVVLSVTLRLGQRRVTK